TRGADSALGWVCEETGELTLQGHVGVRPGTPALVARQARGEGLAGEAVARLATVTVADAAARDPEDLARRIECFGMSEGIGVPLVVGNDRALGAVVLTRRAAHPFSERERKLAE